MSPRNSVPRNEYETQSREQSLEVLALMRRKGLTLEAAADTVNIDPRTVRRYVGSEIHKSRTSGQYVPTPHDTLRRDLHFFTSHGRTNVTVYDSLTASRIADFMNALRSWRAGNSSALEEFKGKSFQASEGIFYFVTDPEILAQLEDAGELAIERLYRFTYGG